jgi:hypothetical protein
MNKDLITILLILNLLKIELKKLNKTDGLRMKHQQQFLTRLKENLVEKILKV